MVRRRSAKPLIAGSSPALFSQREYANVGELGQTVNLILRLSRFESYYSHFLIAENLLTRIEFHIHLNAISLLIKYR